MERRWEEENVEKDVDDEDAEEEEEDDVDWRMPSELSSPSTKIPSLQKGPSSSILAHGDEPCLQSKLGHSRTIVHIDLDCFYAQVEMLRNPTLRDKPLGIQQKNIVVTTNYVARARGVSKLSYVKDALIKCPDLILVSGEDLTNYRETSTKVTELLEQFCPLVERLGFDENFMDVTQLVESRLSSTDSKKLAHIGHSYEDDANIVTQCHCGCRERLIIGSHIAKEMRDALKSKLGLTSCAGVATNKLLAKLVGGHHKPNNQTVLFSEWNGSFMQTFTKLRQIPGIGHSSGKKLKAMGIQNLEELRATPVSMLADLFGQQQAETMLRLAHGVDDTPVVSKGLPQSLSDEDSFKKVGTLPAAKETMTGLIKNLIKRLRSDGRIPHTMRVTVRKYVPGSWHRESRQTGISADLFHKQDDNSLLDQLLDVAVALLQKLIDTTRPFHLTLINICFTNLRSKVTKGSLDSFFSKPAVKSEGTVKSQLQNFSVECDVNSPASGKDNSNAKEMGDLQSANHEVLNESEFATSSRNKMIGDKRNIVNHTQKQFGNSGGFTNLRTSVNLKGRVETEGSTSFFKKLSSSPRNKSKSSLHKEKRETPYKHQTVDEEWKEHIYSTTETDTDNSTGGFDGQFSFYEEVDGLTQSSKNANSKQASKRTFEESSRSDVVECNVDDTGGKRMKNDLEPCDTKPIAEGNEEEIPPDIDRSVFDALPSNMKEELIADWKKAKKQREDDHQLASSLQDLPKNKKPSSSSAKKKQPPSVRNTITKYFKH